MPSKSQREELMDSMRERGLSFSGIAANLWGEKLINTDDQSKYISEFRKNSDFARDLSIAGVRVDCVQPPTIHREVDYKTAFDRVVKTWRTCCDIAADNGQYVTWEFEPGFAFNKPSDILRIHDAVDKRNFGLLYDTCHGREGWFVIQGLARKKKKKRSPIRWNSSASWPAASITSIHRFGQYLPQDGKWPGRDLRASSFRPRASEI